MKQVGMLDLLSLYGFDQSKTRAKFLRHKDPNYPIEEVRSNGWVNLYQSYQSKPRFHGLDVIISFCGIEGIRVWVNRRVDFCRASWAKTTVN